MYIQAYGPVNTCYTTLYYLPPIGAHTGESALKVDIVYTCFAEMFKNKEQIMPDVLIFAFLVTTDH
jgi:hypothetical protein